MTNSNFSDRHLKAIEMAERNLDDYEKFNDIYNLEDKEYFIEKLTGMGYTKDEVSSTLINKDLMLALFMNSFETIVIESDSETKIDIDLELEEVRKKYIDAIDFANQSIEAANESCKIMNSLKSLIEAKYGFNSNDWDEESVREMNEAIKIYNRLVEQANADVQHSKDVRQELAKVRRKKKKISNDIVLEAS